MPVKYLQQPAGCCCSSTVHVSSSCQHWVHTKPSAGWCWWAPAPLLLCKGLRCSPCSREELPAVGQRSLPGEIPCPEDAGGEGDARGFALSLFTFLLFGVVWFWSWGLLLLSSVWVCFVVVVFFFKARWALRRKMSNCDTCV